MVDKAALVVAYCGGPSCGAYNAAATKANANARAADCPDGFTNTNGACFRLSAPKPLDASVVQQVLLGGDLSKLTPEQRVAFYNRVCESLGLNPLTRPFEFIVLNGKMTLYARKDATDQAFQAALPFRLDSRQFIDFTADYGTALARLRDLHTDMTLLQAQCLLTVAANPGMTQRSLYSTLGVSDSLASRVIGLLGEHGSRSVEALNLIVSSVNPDDRRERNCELSPKGRRLMTQIVADLNKQGKVN